MHSSIQLISTLAYGLGLAMVFGFLAIRLRLPTLVGYLFAGMLLGATGLISDQNLSHELAEVGVILLMFGVGLHFSLKDLLAVKALAIPGALLQIVLATAMGTGLAWFWHWPMGEALVFGVALSVASTVVLLRALEAKGLLTSVNGRIAVGWLVVEDLIMVLVLVLLPAFANIVQPSGQQTVDIPWIFPLALTLGKVAAFVALMLVVGRRVFPKLLWWVARSGSRELFNLCVVATALGVAFMAASLFDVSFALGAFFAGMMMRESEYSHRAADESLPLRDAFSVLFFVSVGMLFNPQVILSEPVKLLAVVFVVVVGKTLVASILVLVMRYPLNTALTVAVSLAQIGEFSFILIGLGKSLNLMSDAASNLVLAAAFISICLNSFLFAAVEPAQAWIRKRSALARRLETRDDPLAALPMDVDQTYLTGQVVIVGFGRIGRQVSNWLRGNEVRFVVAEQKRVLVELLREQDIPAVLGDACEPATLIQAHIHKASLLIITQPDSLKTKQMIDIAKTLNPSVETLLIAPNPAEAALMMHDNLGEIFVSEWEIAKSMANHALKRFGKSVEIKSDE